jgi:hypothetical protein
MAWNPDPKVADCREIARRWNQEQVIVLALDGEGRLQLVTYGRTRKLCDCAWALGQEAFEAIQARIRKAEREMGDARRGPEPEGTAAEMRAGEPTQ